MAAAITAAAAVISAAGEATPAASMAGTGNGASTQVGTPTV
jgi:hypothetical protein